MKHELPTYFNRLIFLVFLASIMAGCATSLPKAAVTRSSKPITIAQFGHIFLYLPIYVAQDKGFFSDEGLDVRLISTGGDEKTFAAVTSGNAQFGVADPTFTAIARQRGQGGKVVASIVNGVPFWGIAFRDDVHQIRRPQDFDGLRIATYSAPSTNYAVMKKVLQNNGKQIDAKIVQGSATGSIVAMVKANDADIAMEIEPAASIAVNQGAHIVASLGKQFGDFAITGLTIVDGYESRDRAAIQSVVHAISRALKFIHSDFEGTLAVAKKEFPEIEPQILRAALKRMLSEGTIPISPIISKEAWDKAIALRRETGDLTGDGSFASNVDMTFAHKEAR